MSCPHCAHCVARWNLLEGDDWAKLERCVECGAPFKRVKRQEYCSITCSQVARDKRRKTGAVYVSRKQREIQA